MTKNCYNRTTHLSLTALFMDAPNAKQLIVMLLAVMSLDAMKALEVERQRKTAIDGLALSIAQKTDNTSIYERSTQNRRLI